MYSLVFGVRLTDRLGTFLELFGDRQTTGTIATSASVDGGLTLLVTDIVQVDVSVGRGLWGPTDDVFVGTGLSFRLPRQVTPSLYRHRASRRLYPPIGLDPCIVNARLRHFRAVSRSSAAKMPNARRAGCVFHAAGKMHRPSGRQPPNVGVGLPTILYCGLAPARKAGQSSAPVVRFRSAAAHEDVVRLMQKDDAQA